MDMQCRLVTPTPIQYLGTGPRGQRIYIKRDDLLGFSFGGNKCRIAEVLLQDMKEKGCDFFVSYGSRKSNLNRVVGTLCKAEKIPCLVITALEDGEKEDTFNSRILERMEIQSVFCDKFHVRETVEQTLADLRDIILIISMEIPPERGMKRQFVRLTQLLMKKSGSGRSRTGFISGRFFTPVEPA